MADDRVKQLEQEVADRRHAEQELKRVQRQLQHKTGELSRLLVIHARRRGELQAILDGADSVIVMVNPAGRITACNDKVRHFLGLDPDAMEGQEIGDFLIRARAAFVEPHHFDALCARLQERPDSREEMGQDPHFYQKRLLRLREPATQVLSLFSLPVQDKQGQVLGRVWIMPDVTAATKAEEQVHTIVEVSPVPLVISRLEVGQILFANEPMARLVGIELEQLIGRSAEAFYADPADRQAVVERLREQGSLKGHEVRLQRQDGRTFWASLSLATAELGGETVLLGGIHDIDERKQMEQALVWERNFVRAIVDTANALVVVLDPEGRIVLFNKACQRTTGHASGEVVGRPFWEMLLAEDELREVREVFNKLSAGDYPNTHENDWLTRDGERRRISWSNTALLDDAGEVEYVVSTGVDITDRKAAERALRDKQAQLMQSEKMAALGMLVAGIAHEINTPIGAVNSMHDTLVLSAKKLRQILESDFPEQAASHRKLQRVLKAIDDANAVIHSGTERVTTIVRRLRSFARLDEAELKQVDVHEGLEDTLTIIHHEIKHKVELVRDYGQLPPIACYPGPLNQVFLNLLINANQAIEERGTIRLSTRVDQGRAEIEIADDGQGMPPEVIKRIFDPGFTTKGVGVGTGLGLSICYQIIQDHHGEIRVRSEPGRGASFTVVLPLDLDRILGKQL
jgi:two-component system NtrC family sensor kinase